MPSSMHISNDDIIDENEQRSSAAADCNHLVVRGQKIVALNSHSEPLLGAPFLSIEYRFWFMVQLRWTQIRFNVHNVRLLF